MSDMIQERDTRRGFLVKLVGGATAAVAGLGFASRAGAEGEAPVEAMAAGPQGDTSLDNEIVPAVAIVNRSEAAQRALERSRINGKGWDRVEDDDKVVITKGEGVLASYHFPGAEYNFMIDRPDDVKGVADKNEGRKNGELVYVDPFPGRNHPDLPGVSFKWGITLSLGSDDNPVQFKLGREIDEDGDVLRVFATFQEPTEIHPDSKAKFQAAPPDQQEEVIRILNVYVGEDIASGGHGDEVSGGIPEAVKLANSTEASPSAIVLAPVA